MHRVVDAGIRDDLARLEYGHGASWSSGDDIVAVRLAAALTGVNSR
jgi:hypothetical protein